MSNLVKSTFLLMLATMLAKVVGFIREIVLMYTYGTSLYSDVYITAMNIPLVLFSSIGAALVTTFIPIYHENLKSRGEKEALKFTNNILNIILFISLLIAIIGYIFAEPLVKLFAIEFTGYKLDLATKFVRVMIPGILFIAISNIFTSYLQINGNFTIPGMIALPNNIIIIISIIISSITGNFNILSLGSLIAMLSQVLYLYPFVKKNGYRYKFIFNMKDEYLKKMIFLVGPVFIGVAVSQINVMVDRSLASTLGDGIIAALNSANRLNLFVTTLFISTISAVIYPTLSKLSMDSDIENFSKSIVTSINSVILLILPVSMGAIVLSSPIVKILFERGAFDEKSTQLTSVALIFYSIGMIGTGLRDILSKVFYSLKDTKTPMINGIIAVILNIVLNVIFVKVMGHGGLALATSLSAIICMLLLFRSLRRKIGDYGQNKIINVTIKSLISSILMGAITHFTYKYYISIFGGGLIKECLVLGTSILMGGTVYFILLNILKVNEVKLVIKTLKSKCIKEVTK